MVFTGRDEDVTVSVGGDASGLNNALDGAIAKLGSLRNAVGLAGAALAGLAAGGLAAATSAAADFEEQMVEVEKVTSPEIAAEMSDRIREMAAEMPVAQENLAGIAAQAGRFGVEGSENIEQFTESVAQMAVATDLTEQEAGEAFARMTTLMDEPIDNIQDLGDAVNGLSNNMATSASEITNAATRSSGTLSQLGLQSEQILALNATMNEVSASSRIAGTRLRRFAQEMMDPGKAEDLAAALGMTTQEFRSMREDDPNALMREMVATFGEGGDAADQLRKTLSTTSRQALASLAQNTEGWATAQEIANEQMGAGTSLQEEYAAAADTFNNKIQVLKNRVRNAAIAVGEDLLPVMTDLVETVTGAFDGFEGLNEQFDTNVGTIALVSTLIGGLTAALVAFAPAAAGAAAGIAAIAAPALAVAAAVGALWVAWEENLFGMQEVVDDVVVEVEPLFEDVMGVLEDLAAGAQEAFEGISTWVEDNGDAIDSAIGGIVSAIGVWIDIQRRLVGAWRTAFERFVLPIVRRVADAIGRNLGPVLEEAGETFQALAGYARDAGTVLTGVWQSVEPVVVPIVKTIADVIGSVLGYQIDQLAEAMQLVMNLVQGDFGAALDNLKNILGNAIDGAFNIVDAIRDGLTAAWKWVKENGADLLERAFDWFTDTEDGLPALIVDGITGGLSSLVDGTIQWIQDLADRLRDKIKAAVKDGVTLGMSEFGDDGETTAGVATDAAEATSSSGSPSGMVRDFALGRLGVPGFATGGLVERGGLARIHAGERVVPAAQVSDRGPAPVEGGGTDPRAIARAVRSALSGAGLRVDVGDETLEAVIDEEAELVFDQREGQTFDRLRREGVLD